MRHLIHLVDDSKFKFVSDLDEIGHYEIINSRSTNKDGHWMALSLEEVIKKMPTTRVRTHERRDSRTRRMEHVREHNRHVDGPESAETHETSFGDEEQDEKENEDKIKRMLQNLEEINRQEKLCTDLIGKELRSWKLKGHCKFV